MNGRSAARVEVKKLERFAAEMGFPKTYFQATEFAESRICITLFATGVDQGRLACEGA